MGDLDDDPRGDDWRSLAEMLHVLVWSGTNRLADFYNRCWLDFTGTGPIVDWRLAIHPDDMAACQAAFDGAGRGEISTCKVRLRRADHTYQRRLIRWFDPAGGHGLHRWFATAQELDDEERMVAERANRRKDQVIAAISHELRTPLATMMLWEKALRDDPSVQVRALAAIHESAVTQSHLIDNLLDLSRAMHDELHIDSQPVAITESLTTALERIGPAAASKSIEIAARHQSDLGDVLGDRHRLGQVLDNILESAVANAATGGHITALARRVKSAIEVEVCAIGPENPELAPDLFASFDHCDDPFAASLAEPGLGLALARQLAELHGGSLRAHVGDFGRVATFVLTLPINGRDSTVSPAATPQPPSRLIGIRVLVVDDNRDMREAMEVVLGIAGATTVCASSVAAAWASILNDVPDVVVSDIILPDEDGYSLVRKIRALHVPRRRAETRAGDSTRFIT